MTPDRLTLEQAVGKLAELALPALWQKIDDLARQQDWKAAAKARDGYDQMRAIARQFTGEPER